MKKTLLLALAFSTCGLIVLAQNRNWPTYGGDPQRSGWQGADASIFVDSVKNLQLLWKIKLETKPAGMRTIMPPIIQGRLISYRGFRELAFVATNADIVYAIDADVGTVFWQKHLEYSVRDAQVTSSSWRCPGGLTAMPTMPPPGRGGAPAQPVARGSAFIGGPLSAYALSSDGRLHRLNTSTGDDMTQPVSVLPPNARVLNLNMVDNVIYAVTSHECNDAPNAVWAVDLNVDPVKVRSFELKSGSGWGLGGPVVGNDGTVYALTADSVVALSPRDLQLKQNVSLQGKNLSDAINVASPVVFSYKDRDLIVVPCAEGRLCLVDSTNVYRTPKLAERGITGSLSTWLDKDGTRWVLASVTAPTQPDMKFPVTHGATPNGFIAAFKLQDQNGTPTLVPVWTSRDLDSPMPPVIANGVVFALSAGEITRRISENGNNVDERPKGSTHATLYAFDAQSGAELYSSRNLVSVPAALTGIAVANGRVYFGGIDGTLYAFGMYMEH
jgi:outer membrane protein assembly factor BamB